RDEDLGFRGSGIPAFRYTERKGGLVYAHRPVIPEVGGYPASLLRNDPGPFTEPLQLEPETERDYLFEINDLPRHIAVNGMAHFARQILARQVLTHCPEQRQTFQQGGGRLDGILDSIPLESLPGP